MGPVPAVAEIRRAVRQAVADLSAGDLVLVACSGGTDSLALACATAFAAPRLGLRFGALTVDHRLQQGSDERAGQVADSADRPRLRPRRGADGLGRRRRWPRGRRQDRPLRRARRGGAPPRRRRGAARPHARRPGRDGAARPGARLRRAIPRRHARRVRALPPAAARRPQGDHDRGLPRRVGRALGGPAQRRLRLHQGPRAPCRAARADRRARPRHTGGARPHRRSSCGTTPRRSTTGPTRSSPRAARSPTTSPSPR